MLFYVLCFFLLCKIADGNLQNYKKTNDLQKCNQLSKFQYKCSSPIIDPTIQQPATCQPDNSIIVSCWPIPGIVCDGLLNDTRYFELRIPDSCDYNAHISFSTALLLSIFLGFLGIDRIYLGYYAIGLFKMFTLGGLFMLWLTDIVLICLQILLPADGTSYVIPYYGPKVSPLRFNPSYMNFSYYHCYDCL